MKGVRVFFVALLTIAALSAFGQDWQGPYEEGIRAARASRWAEAREAFLRANTVRPGDSSEPTNLPGPPTERRQWRNGAPYSPNFLAAYAGYRSALEMTDEAQQKALLSTSAAELQTLVDRNQAGPEVFYYLNVIYGRLGDKAKQRAAETAFTSARNAGKWREDTEIVAPEDLALIQGSTTASGAAQPLTTTISAETLARTGIPKTISPGAVPTLSTKYALVIGNSAGSDLAFAANDAKRVRDALLTNAGYPEENVTLVTDGTVEQIKAAATELASRVPEEGVVTIFFTGRTRHVAGKDYLGGADADGWLGKSELFMPFVQRAARIFAFFQTNRQFVGQDYFGKEVPSIGAVSQMQATSPGGTVERTVRGGAEAGVFADAFTRVLMDLRSNQVPVMEFGWQVFYKVRRGDSGTTGGGSLQTPTLPVLTNLASDARF